MTVRYDARRATLTFNRLLPRVARDSPLVADVQAFVGSRHARSLPAHRRVDARRVNVDCVYGRGAVSLVLHLTERHHAYAARKGVNLVNEIFTVLQASYPQYLSDVFGVPAE